MKYADLIRAALDGEEIQYKFNGNWNTFGHTKTAIQCLMNENPASEYRIKPEPKPDRVWHNVANSGGDLAAIRVAWRRELEAGDAFVTKTTIKTDENGNQTTTVEIVPEGSVK